VLIVLLAVMPLGVDSQVAAVFVGCHFFNRPVSGGSPTNYSERVG
jgi:hypothetical protein